MVPVSIKHPYYDMDLERAMSLATRLHRSNGLLPSPQDIVPTYDEAIELLWHERRTIGHNWITGRVAEQVIRAANGEPNPFTT
jgi:hypothetical protein